MEYRARLLAHLIRYKYSVLRIREPGTFQYRGRAVPKEHVLPRAKKWANLLGLAQPLVKAHLAANGEVRLHRYFHHLNSSQAFAFNLFFPFFGGPKAGSSSLLRALGQAPPLESWEPESIPDKDEGTNLDAKWQLADGTVVMCEVKLSEADFGRASTDEKHRRKLEVIYRRPLSGHVDGRMLQEPEFFRAYQFLRNVWHIILLPGSKLVFLLPRANTRLWDKLTVALAALHPSTRERVAAVAIEDVLAYLRSDAQCPAALREYAGDLEAKYVVEAS
ncbi:MAG: hypothetical protein WCG85_19555 [Polyangia bacterium]